MHHVHDIVIVGGGPVGLITACMLAKQGIKTTIIDSDILTLTNTNTSIIDNDGRLLSLSANSVNCLQSLGAWNMQAVNPIKQVHISHSGFGISKINAQNLNLFALGYTMRYSDLMQTLRQQAILYSKQQLINIISAKATSVTNDKYYASIFAAMNSKVVNKNHATNHHNQNTTIEQAKAVIMAEGGHIAVTGINYKKINYQKTALIITFTAKNGWQTGVAFKRFDKEGPFVVLPHGEYGIFTMVWSIDNNKAHQLSQDKHLLLTQLKNMSFMRRFLVEDITSIKTFPLQYKVASHKAIGRIALVGAAAQIVHPIAAQGLNLGIRDAIDLCKQVVKHYQRHNDRFDAKCNAKPVTQFNNNLDDGFTHCLSQYDTSRRRDSDFVNKFSHCLATMSNNHSLVAGLVRSIGITGLNNMRPLQNWLIRLLIFGA